MLIIRRDYHPSFQQIAFVDKETGELGERRLLHSDEAEQFYGKLREQSVAVRVGMEASGRFITNQAIYITLDPSATTSLDPETGEFLRQRQGSYRISADGAEQQERAVSL